MFELVNDGGSYTPVTLVSFDLTNRQFPSAGLITDAAGDLFGATFAGGANGDGTVFELVNNDGGGYTLTTLASFNGTDGNGSEGSLIADAAGDLFGTTTHGGASGDGMVFEIPGTAAVTPTPPNFFNNDNKADILWQNTNGDVYLWNSNSGSDEFHRPEPRRRRRRLADRRDRRLQRDR